RDPHPDRQHVDQRAVVPAADAEPLPPARDLGAQPMTQRRRQRGFSAAPGAHEGEPRVPARTEGGHQRPELGRPAAERVRLLGKPHGVVYTIRRDRSCRLRECLGVLAPRRRRLRWAPAPGTDVLVPKLVDGAGYAELAPLLTAIDEIRALEETDH